jgi:hypothetical protein
MVIYVFYSNLLKNEPKIGQKPIKGELYLDFIFLENESEIGQRRIEKNL